MLDSHLMPFPTPDNARQRRQRRGTHYDYERYDDACGRSGHVSIFAGLLNPIANTNRGKTRDELLTPEPKRLRHAQNRGHNGYEVYDMTQCALHEPCDLNDLLRAVWDS